MIAYTGFDYLPRYQCQKNLYAENRDGTGVKNLQPILIGMLPIRNEAMEKGTIFNTMKKAVTKVGHCALTGKIRNCGRRTLLAWRSSRPYNVEFVVLYFYLFSIQSFAFLVRRFHPAICVCRWPR